MSFVDFTEHGITLAPMCRSCAVGQKKAMPAKVSKSRAHKLFAVWKEMTRVHKMQTMLSFTVAGVRYSGGADAAIVPHNVALESAAQQARVLFEIKRRKEVRPDLSEHFGQSVTELIGTSVRSVYPCLHVLTDGIN